MLTTNVHPSSLTGIKRLAKQLKKADGLPHHEALDKASQIASFENYAHARASLNQGAIQIQGEHQLFLTAYWTDHKAFSIGRETYEVWISKPLTDICSKSEMGLARALAWFRSAAEDHLVADHLFESQHRAQSEICKAVRTLRFMEATGLRPARSSEERYPEGGRDNQLPGCDHVTDWIDRETKQFVIIDEPYMKPVVTDERREWAERNGWHLRASAWPGMYYPHHCSLFVATDASHGYDFEALVSKIDSLPDPVTEDSWDGFSVRSHEVFVSPKAKTPQDIRRAKAKGTIYRTSSRSTVPMRLQAARDKRKPNGVMPHSVHQEVGRKLVALLESPGFGPFSWSTINPLRSELEDWLFFEHDERKFGGADFTQIYFGSIDEEDAYLAACQSQNGRIEVLKSVERLLKTYYPECAPLRTLLRGIDRALTQMQTIER